MAALGGRRLQVRVEAALADVLVVSCGAQGRRYQGVLLDCSKRNLPFGVSSLHPAFTLSQKGNNINDKLYSVSQRFAYQDPDYKIGLPVKTKEKPQRSKMTVRLRPRKVLCSKCKGICNENSENVAQTRKRKNVDVGSDGREKKPFISQDPNEHDDASSQNKTLIMGNSLIPKISRLHPNEITNALNGNNACPRNEIWIQQTNEKCENMEKLSRKLKRLQGSSDSNGEYPDNYSKSEAVYSPSDKSSDNKFLDDKEFDSECERQTQKDESHNRFESDSNTSKKKHRIENSSNNTDESSNSLFSNARTLKISFGEGEGTVVKLPVTIVDYNSAGEEASSPFPKNGTKAARRALKKAKKQARRQVTPEPQPSSPSCDVPYKIFQRKHKHKVKHKKKRRDEKKIKETGDDVSESETPDENHSSIEEFNIKEKLALNLDDLQEDSLEGNDSSDERKIPDDATSDWVNCEGGYSGIGAGDVIWGKLQGFPWWPGRIIAMVDESQARVAWFASNTSSIVPQNRLAPFLDNFKVHFNKKKRGPYKEAVRQATLEAGGPLDPLATDPLAPTSGNTLTPLSSPPIDVLS